MGCADTGYQNVAMAGEEQFSDVYQAFVELGLNGGYRNGLLPDGFAGQSQDRFGVHANLTMVGAPECRLTGGEQLLGSELIGDKHVNQSAAHGAEDRRELGRTTGNADDMGPAAESLQIQADHARVDL